ncbi:MAG: putative secreted hydrolase [Verrucomicrobiales bacterium]|jgi:predicted secreted hydrolase
MKPFVIIAVILGPAIFALTAEEAENSESWRKARPGWTYEFPRDEFAHPDFKTEWWYFTGNLENEAGRRFGYQLTFFRQGIRPPDDRAPTESQFVTDHIWFGHFAVSDIDRDEFYFEETFSRGAFEQAGSQLPDDENRIVWIPGSSLVRTESEPGHYRLRAKAKEFEIDFEIHPAKPPIFHGVDGVSPKSNEPDAASHYYSFTRLKTEGSLMIDGSEFKVSGSSWYDREWSTSALSLDQAGWDWFAIQLEDGSELMLFQLRSPDGSTNFASGTFVRPDGSTEALSSDEIRFKPTEIWTAPNTKVAYPIEWSLRVPKLEIELEVVAAQKDQQLLMAAMIYWEGATRVSGKIRGKPVRGRGYLELTGYDGKISPLSQ